MGLFDSVIGAINQGGAGGGGQGDLLGVVMGLIGRDGGGLAALLAQFQQGGLGDVAASWVSTGQNLPISPEQLKSVLGSDAVASIARQLGLDSGAVAGQLSQLLPQVVDKLTPQGQVPAGPLGGALGGDLGGLGDIGKLLGQFTR